MDRVIDDFCCVLHRCHAGTAALLGSERARMPCPATPPEMAKDDVDGEFRSAAPCRRGQPRRLGKRGPWVSAATGIMTG